MAFKSSQRESILKQISSLILNRSPYFIVTCITFLQVKVQLRRNGDLVLEMSFDGEGTNKYSWFTPSRLTSSPFTGLQDVQLNYFSITG